MSSDAERMARAGQYVLGRMDDAERERAERDLEIDDRFRAAVLAVAERMTAFGNGSRNEGVAAEAVWVELARRLAALPHMQAANLSDALRAGWSLAAEDLPSPAAEARGRSGVRRGAEAVLGSLRRLIPWRGPTRAVALLHAAPGAGPGALVEIFADGSLRVLLLQAFASTESLALWGEGDDGAAVRLGGLRPAGETRLRARAASRCTRLMIAGKEASPMSPGRIPLAQGMPRTLPR